ncbi:LOW QUALITY PROTEIN: ABC transporter, partial [Streptomyces viridochromogenes DSM 40736]
GEEADRAGGVRVGAAALRRTAALRHGLEPARRRVPGAELPGHDRPAAVPAGVQPAARPAGRPGRRTDRPGRRGRPGCGAGGEPARGQQRAGRADGRRSDRGPAARCRPGAGHRGRRDAARGTAAGRQHVRHRSAGAQGGARGDELYLERAARRADAIEEHAFHKLLDTAQEGAASARRMIMYGTRVINAMVSLVAAAGVLNVLHAALLPLLVTMTLPSAWSALTMARRRYESFHAWVQHARAGRLLGSLLIEPEAAPEIRVHGVGGFLLRHFRAMSETAEAEQARLARLAARTGLIAAAWTGVATVATYATLGGLLLAGAMALSVAGTAVIAIRTGSQSLDTLVVEVNALHEEALFVGDLQRLYTEAAQRAIPVGGRALPENPREIRFENVTFRYPGESARPALADVTLTLPLGRIVALVGENGSGKTTLVKLLAGLYTPERGRIVWDDVDAATADRHRLAERIAMVAQDFKRWPFTARVNVALGRTSAPLCEERLATSIAEAGAQTVVADLPRGLDTLLARNFSGGHELSGGQWQRLGIARAAYRRGSILIVDEPTAALDARAELEVFERIRALADSGQTVVLITHRLASVRHADLVHVLDQGRLVESGPPDELLASGGLYAELYALQAEQFTKPPAPVTPPAPVHRVPAPKAG